MDINIILIVLGLVVTGITAFIAIQKKQQITIIKDEELNERINFHYKNLLESIETVVEGINNTIKKKLIEDKDGKLSEEDKEILFETATEEILKLLTNEGYKLLELVIGDIPLFISRRIDAILQKNKTK